ncbi:MAG TPA: hypothetical protein VJ999_04910 [Candidatus Sulfotelmatobacter sp.]|nr:hypothetical protein [Candidatus Sulfotelmatobacter sp.]
MTTHRKLGIAITLVTAIAAAIGVVMGFLSITSAVGLAVVGILIGTGVARGNFSSVPDSTKKN